MSSKRSNSIANPSKADGNRSLSSKKSRKDNHNAEQRLSNENENITIRLSDLGIVKRSPSEVDLLIQYGRITDVIAKTIDKLKITLCLPYLLENNASVLHQYFTNTEVQFIHNVCCKYTHPEHRFRTSLQYQSITAAVEKISLIGSKTMRKAVEKLGFGFGKEHELIDPHMAQVTEILWKSCPLKRHIIINFEHFADTQSMTLVKSMEQLKEIAEKKLAINARDQRTREYRLSQAWKLNSTAQENIEKIEQELEKQRQNLGMQVKMKQALAAKYKSRLDDLTQQFKDEILKITADSEKGMFAKSHASTHRQVELASDAKAATQQYESLLAQHISFEKGLRAKRLKVETQLASWLTKYDTDIGDRHAEFEKLEGGYLEEKARMDELQAKFDEQEEEYVVLMAEKEEEERKIYEERAYVFLCNRSARRIQRAWREYRQRKIERRKAKKDKAKKKKDAAEGGGGGGEAPAKKAKGKDKKGKGKGKEEARPADPMAALDKKFGDDVMGDLQGEGFQKGEVVVDLAAD